MLAIKKHLLGSLALMKPQAGVELRSPFRNGLGYLSRVIEVICLFFIKESMILIKKTLPASNGKKY